MTQIYQQIYSNFFRKVSNLPHYQKRDGQDTLLGIVIGSQFHGIYLYGGLKILKIGGS